MDKAARAALLRAALKKIRGYEVSYAPKAPRKFIAPFWSNYDYGPDLPVCPKMSATVMQQRSEPLVKTTRIYRPSPLNTIAAKWRKFSPRGNAP